MNIARNKRIVEMLREREPLIAFMVARKWLDQFGEEPNLRQGLRAINIARREVRRIAPLN